jgi:hypothetical protein
MRPALVVLLLAACGTDEPAVDPRAVDCATFEMPGYTQTQINCTIDVSDIDYSDSLLGDPGPFVIGGYCGPGCNVSNSATLVSGDLYRVRAVEWSGDTRTGVAVMVKPAEMPKCVWKQCQ